MQGQINTKLNETGIKQATLAGKVLKETHFDRAYSSGRFPYFNLIVHFQNNNRLLQFNIKSETPTLKPFTSQHEKIYLFSL